MAANPGRDYRAARCLAVQFVVRCSWLWAPDLATEDEHLGVKQGRRPKSDGAAFMAESILSA